MRNVRGAVPPEPAKRGVPARPMAKDKKSVDEATKLAAGAPPPKRRERAPIKLPKLELSEMPRRAGQTSAPAKAIPRRQATADEMARRVKELEKAAARRRDPLDRLGRVERAVSGKQSQAPRVLEKRAERFAPVARQNLARVLKPQEKVVGTRPSAGARISPVDRENAVRLIGRASARRKMEQVKFKEDWKPEDIAPPTSKMSLPKPKKK